MKEFNTAVQAAEDVSEGKAGWIDFKVDGVKCRARRPSPGQVAYLTASLHRNAPVDRQIAGAINFCMAIMDRDSSAYLSDKLLDAEDPFELPEIQDIIEYLVEEWAGRPTGQSSDSSPTEGTTGGASTRARKKTSSRAASTAS